MVVITITLTILPYIIHIGNGSDIVDDSHTGNVDFNGAGELGSNEHYIYYNRQVGGSSAALPSCVERRRRQPPTWQPNGGLLSVAAGNVRTPQAPVHRGRSASWTLEDLAPALSLAQGSARLARPSPSEA